jgi:hypothetical protein
MNHFTPESAKAAIYMSPEAVFALIWQRAQARATAYQEEFDKEAHSFRIQSEAKFYVKRFLVSQDTRETGAIPPVDDRDKTMKRCAVKPERDTEAIQGPIV